jgi:hypothetical protein
MRRAWIAIGAATTTLVIERLPQNTSIGTELASYPVPVKELLEHVQKAKGHDD